MTASDAASVMSHISTISEWNPGPLSSPMVGISTSLTRALTLIRPSL